MNSKESFVNTFLDSEQYYKSQEVNNGNINEQFNLSHKTVPFDIAANSSYYSVLEDQGEPTQTQEEWVNKNSLYNDKTINGIPLKDYYEQYTNDVLNNGRWFLNKDMPQDTRQYVDDTIVQRKMEIATGMIQKSDRALIGVPTKQEVNNLFTPQERTTGYGYQYGIGGKGGPGYNLTRQKEMEELKETMKFKNNELPFEPIKVSRGIALSPEVPAAGGFQQFTRVMPDNVSDYKANQLPGVVGGGKWAFSNAPTAQAPVVKNHPNGYYSLCQRGPATGKSVITAETIRPDMSVLLKSQNRSFINYGYGAPTSDLNSFLCN